MKNNGLIFLGFLIICLVNLSAKNAPGHAAPAAHRPPTLREIKSAAPATDMKMAAEPDSSRTGAAGNPSRG